jgi:hypothetical protein
MPYSEPVKADSPLVKVRQIARLAHLLLDLKAEYETRQRLDTLNQIRQRSAELNALAQELGEDSPPSPDNQSGGK